MEQTEPSSRSCLGYRTTRASRSLLPVSFSPATVDQRDSKKRTERAGRHWPDGRTGHYVREEGNAQLPRGLAVQTKGNPAGGEKRRGRVETLSGLFIRSMSGPQLKPAFQPSIVRVSTFQCTSLPSPCGLSGSLRPSIHRRSRYVGSQYHRIRTDFSAWLSSDECSVEKEKGKKRQ